MKYTIILISLLTLTACQTTQKVPNQNKDGYYVATDTKGNSILDKNGNERIIPLCPEKGTKEHPDMSGYTADELATIIQFGCTPKELVH